MPALSKIDPSQMRLGKGGAYRICRRCVMDTSDPEITFDDDGICHHCHEYAQGLRRHVRPGADGRAAMGTMAEEAKAAGRGKPYDCIIGLSGGVDSTYVAWLVKKLGLRPLALHVDNGWNSELAVSNIERTVTKLGIDLHTEVLDWEEFRDLQLAFLHASTPDIEIPTDHAIVASMFRLAERHGIRHLIVGTNRATEQMLPRAWSNGHGDWGYIKGVHARFGSLPLRSYPHFTYADLMLRYLAIRRIRWIPILDWADYDKAAAMAVLQRELGWRPYGGKHHESIYTRFYQGYILPRKFGVDKRRAHLSCLINGGQISRDAALAELERPAVDMGMLEQDRVFISKKLGLTETALDALMAEPPRSFWDYPSDEVAPTGVTWLLKAVWGADWLPRAAIKRFLGHGG